MKYLVLAGACLFGAPAAEADIRIKMDEIAKGSSVTYLVEDGTRRTHHFEGEQDGAYVVTFWKGRGKGLDAGLYGTARYNADGRMISLTRPGGRKITYTPHNCFRVVGECRYTATRDTGETRDLGRRQEPTKDGFTFQNFRVVEGGDEVIVAEGRVSLDEMGMMQELTLERGASSDLQPMTQESADYR